MKIKCEYCDSMFDDTLEKCPNCGAPNSNVRRSTADQPTTIEGLKEWYESKDLPPYETTRFFIGIDYKKPRAFGIYKDENTGNFIVYKNKDSGQRAVRYEGTDEAFAVNELFMRLKQEILEQKAHNISNGSNTGYSGSVRHNTSGSGSLKKHKASLAGVIAIVIVISMACCGPYLLTMLLSPLETLVVNLSPAEQGYYSYNGEDYYTCGPSEDNKKWFKYDRAGGEWIKTSVEDKPELLMTKTAQNYFRSFEYSTGYDFPNFYDSSVYYEYCYPAGYTDTGYYSYNNTDYYRLDSYDTDSWYYFSNDTNDWEPAEYNDIPDDLKNGYNAKDFYYTPDWNSETQISDFEDTEYYALYESENSSSSYSGDSYSYSSWDDDDDYDYSWDSGSSWDSSSSDWDSDW